MPACQACSLKLRRSSGLTMPGAARYSRNHRICARNRLVGQLEMIAEAESLAQPRVQASDPVLLCLSFAGVSSNGRTLVFGASYLGSNPGTPAIFLSPPHALRLCSPSASSSRSSVRSGALSCRSGMPGKESFLYILCEDSNRWFDRRRKLMRKPSTMSVKAEGAYVARRPRATFSLRQLRYGVHPGAPSGGS